MIHQYPYHLLDDSTDVLGVFLSSYEVTLHSRSLNHVLIDSLHARIRFFVMLLERGTVVRTEESNYLRFGIIVSTIEVDILVDVSEPVEILSNGERFGGNDSPVIVQDTKHGQHFLDGFHMRFEIAFGIRSQSVPKYFHDICYLLLRWR